MYVELTKKFQDSLSEKKKAEQISIGDRDRHRHHHQNHGHSNQPKKDLSHLPPKKESLLVTQMPAKPADNQTTQNSPVVAPPVTPSPTPVVVVEDKKVVTPPIAPNGSDKEKDRKIPDLRQLPGLRVMGKIDLTPRKKEVPPPTPPPGCPCTSSAPGSTWTPKPPALPRARRSRCCRTTSTGRTALSGRCYPTAASFGFCATPPR